MLISIWNFIKRHKRKLIFTGAVVGGIYYASRYARTKLRDFQDNEATECLSRARKQHHFDSNQRTCNMTVMAMLPGIKDALMQILNSEQLTENLKSKPVNKMEIWEELKILSFTRTVSAVYVVSMVVVVLRVQLNVIGGYMYQDTVNNSDDMLQTNSNAVAPPDVQGQYLAAIQYLVHDGLHALVAAVRKEVEKNVGKITLKENVSLLKVQTTINHIRQEMEHKAHNGYYDGAGSRLCTFMLPPHMEEEQAVQLSRTDLMYRKLMKETQDMIESGDFHAVMTTCLDTGFNRMLDKLAEFYKPSDKNGTVFSPTEVTLPLAKVIPVMNGLVHSICGETHNPFVQELLLKDQVRDFAANVYEAFCQPEKQQTP